MHIAIVGGGFAGTVVACRLLDLAPAGTQITIFEPAAELGRGVAYARGPDHFLLNVPARYITPFGEEPGGFLAWLLQAKADAARYEEADGSHYVPRSWFGDYMAAALAVRLQACAGRIRLIHRRAVVAGLSAAPSGLRIVAGGSAELFDAAVLAVGSPPPRPLAVAASDGQGIQQSAWDRPAAPAPDARVAIVGSGLTMADAVVDLTAAGHRGPIAVVSRHGLIPNTSGGHLAAYAPPPEPTAATAAALTRQVRRWAAHCVAETGDWRPLVDHLRRQVPQIWGRLPEQERSRFLRHLRSYWEVHRYQMPPATRRVLEAALDSGRLMRVRARAVAIGRDGLAVRQEGRLRVLPADLVINATGPDGSFGTAPAPLDRLLEIARPDLPRVQRRGLCLDDDGRLPDMPEDLRGRLWCVGYLGRACHGELATVNPIGAMAARLAAALVRRHAG